MSALLQVSGLNAWYGAAHILRDVALDVGRGEVVALMGRNGAGKSTTLEAIMGMVAKRSGVVRFDGEDIARLAPYQRARRGLGFTPKDRRIFTDLTVAENLDVGRQPPRANEAAPAWTRDRVLALFPQLAEMLHRSAGTLSGGEQQMLTLARTLMGNPRLLLLDEPSEGVAPIVVERMAAAILELKAQGLAILLSEQNVPFASLVSDRAYALEKGQVRWSGTMAALRADEAMQREFLTL